MHTAGRSAVFVFTKGGAHIILCVSENRSDLKMAKNKARKNRPQDQAKPKTAAAAEAQDLKEQETASGAAVESQNSEAKAQAAGEQKTAAEKPAEAAKPERENKSSKKKEALYRVVTKKDSGIIKAYITFTYRVFHPGVSARLFIYGLLILLPGVFFFKDMFWKLFFIVIGIAVMLLAFFRQYISLGITKKNDPDYKSGAEFTYDFYENSAAFFKNGERFSQLDKYKDITNFYYDDGYYYLAIKGRDLFVIPKDRFTVGDPAEFEDFIYKKSKHSCRWIPDKFGDKLKKRRAERTISAEKMSKR